MLYFVGRTSSIKFENISQQEKCDSKAFQSRKYSSVLEKWPGITDKICGNI